MLNRIKILKRYCKATLNSFLVFNKNNFDDGKKKSYLNDRLFVSNRNFILNMLKILNDPGF